MTRDAEQRDGAHQMVDDATFSHRYATLGAIRLHYVTAGPEDGPLVLLLHGFPARWSTWRRQLVDLSRAGFFVVAPDLRGYGESDKPDGIEGYSLKHLVGDVVALISTLGRTRAFVCGHDFGGGVAWAIAMSRPDVVERFAVLNSVHPIGFERQMRRWSQIKKSWYIFFFLLPWIPEWFLAKNDFRFLKRSLADDDLTPDVVDDLIVGVRSRGALHAAINWYRASFRDGAKRLFVPQKVDLPCLVVWGDRERHLDPELATPPADWVSDARVEHVPEGSHWVHHDAPDKVTALLAQHFRS